MFKRRTLKTALAAVISLSVIAAPVYANPGNGNGGGNPGNQGDRDKPGNQGDRGNPNSSGKPGGHGNPGDYGSHGNSGNHGKPGNSGNHQGGKGNPGKGNSHGEQWQNGGKHSKNHNGRKNYGRPDHVDRDISFSRARAMAVHHGYTGYRNLPPGIAKNLARGKPLPPGIAKKYVPASMLNQLPYYPGYEWRVVGRDLVLIAASTAIVTAIINGVFN